MADRLMMIGDVHGCAAELATLLEWLSPDAQVGDRVVFVGDLVNRGPDSRAVLDLARQAQGQCVLGNHEARLVRYHRGAPASILKPYDHDTLKVMRDEDWAWLSTWPLTLAFPPFHTVVVHGGFLPNLPWPHQPAEVVTEIQVIDANGQPARRSAAPEAAPWADYWEKLPFVVYGHTPRRRPLVRTYSLGIDTGCVYGGRLTAFVWPEGKIYQVKGKRRLEEQLYEPVWPSYQLDLPL